jgi:prepilin-type N-terminal cleavage/methylation domain-containing protein/prepilin-type processing-associated H-X9-DG protein
MAPPPLPQARILPKRVGFSLVELLVVVAIVGILTALLLPAVQRARESANRVRCANNLRQIGIALHHYHDVSGSFPPGGLEWRPPGVSAKRQLAWSVFVLPFLEQQSVYDRVDLKEAFDSPVNGPAAATVLAVYLCPSTPRSTFHVEGRAVCDFGGVYGERITSPNNPPKGAMIYDRPFRLAEILDGAAGTLIVAEASGFPDGQWINGLNLFDQAYAINHAPPGEHDIRSDHTRGAHGLFCDGSVRFLPEALEPKTLAALCTRAGSETTEVP